MVQTILDGGSKTTQDQYTGPENELSVDQSNRNLRLHDGTTPGGHTILNRDNADTRYQASSTELDGLTGFEPQQRGILVRLGPADYRLRALTVDSGNLKLTNGNGFSGNPKLELAPLITTEHQWDGQQLFTDVVQFDGGINGNLSGDSFGTHTGSVEGDVTGDLTGDSTGTHTGPTIGDVDIRGAEFLFDVGQIPPTAIEGLVALIKEQAEEFGVIKMWSGLEEEIPAGYYLCNGLNNTPDLRNRFIVGAGSGSAYEVGDTGGQNSVTPIIDISAGGAHTHSGDVASHILTISEIPAHKHANGVTDDVGSFFNHGMIAAAPPTSSAVDSETNSGTLEGYTSEIGGGTGHAHDLNLDPGGTHTHVGEIQSINNRPPYYALCYIMRGAPL